MNVVLQSLLQRTSERTDAAKMVPRPRRSNRNRQTELISKNSSVLAFSELDLQNERWR
jgi:hypothetical protein